MENEELNLIERAEKAAKRIEEANKEMAELVKKQESLEAAKLLSGRADGGYKEPKLTKEEKDKMDMRHFFKGTAIERALR